MWQVALNFIQFSAFGGFGSPIRCLLWDGTGGTAGFREL
jgi:hypothetical protein